MRSKGLPARALFRLVTSHSSSAQASQSSTGTAATASGSSSASTPATTSGNYSRPQHRATQSSSSSRSFRRKQPGHQWLGSGSSASVGIPRGRRVSGSNRSRHEAEASTMAHHIKKMLRDAQVSSPSNLAAGHGMPTGSAGGSLTIPPPTSLDSIAMQSFFASGRPLLEHMVVPGSVGMPDAMSNHMMAFGENAHQDEAAASKSTEERSEIAQVKQLLMSAHNAIAEVVSQSKDMSQDELARTTFVIAASDDKLTDAQMIQHIHQQFEEGSQEQNRDVRVAPWSKRVEKIDFARFSRIIDRLAEARSPAPTIIKAEVDALAAEEEHKRDVQTAVEEALEYGENPATAQALGHEADLVILGEPKGAQPDWARGVATHIAQQTRAFEPPNAAEPLDGEVLNDRSVEPQKKSLASRIPMMSRKSNGMVLDMSDDDPNLLLSHAMVQARLPAALAWDKLVAKMDAAALGNDAQAPASIVDVGKLNADMPPPRPGREDDGVTAFIEVNLDSVKRKRRKKMRKHKYKKLRKATRTERSRLKK